MAYKKSFIKYTRSPRIAVNWNDYSITRMKKSSYNNFKKSIKNRKPVLRKIRKYKNTPKKIIGWREYFDEKIKKGYQSYLYNDGSTKTYKINLNKRKSVE